MATPTAQTKPVKSYRHDCRIASRQVFCGAVNEVTSQCGSAFNPHISLVDLSGNWSRVNSTPQLLRRVALPRSGSLPQTQEASVRTLIRKQACRENSTYRPVLFLLLLNTAYPGCVTQQNCLIKHPSSTDKPVFSRPVLKGETREWLLKGSSSKYFANSGSWRFAGYDF